MRLIFLTLCCVIPPSLTHLAAAAWAEDEPTLVEAILAAWDQRQESIRSYQYECDVEIIRPKSDSAEMAAFHNLILLTVSGERVAYYREAESWDPASSSKVKFRWKSVFDGNHGRFLVEGGPPALAQESSGENAGDVVRRDKELFPIWFLHTTASQLDLIGYDPARMRVSRLDSSYDGRDCVDLSVPPSARLVSPPPGVPMPSFRCAILADKTRQFLPVRITELQDGSPVYVVSISYIPHDSLGWAPSEFRAQTFDARTGDPQMSWEFQVKRFVVNQPVDPSVFAMEFPADTHIVAADNIFSGAPEGEDRQYSVQLSDGQRRRITAGDYGRVPTRNVPGTSAMRVASLFMSCVLLVALFIFLMRWRASTRAPLP